MRQITFRKVLGCSFGHHHAWDPLSPLLARGDWESQFSLAGKPMPAVKGKGALPPAPSMGSGLGRACPGLAVRLCPPPRDVLYQGGPIKGTKVLMGCRHPGPALAAGPGLGHRRKLHSQQSHLGSRTEREGAGSRVRLSRRDRDRPLKLCEEDAARLALSTWENRQEAEGLRVCTLESRSLEFRS